MYVFIYFMSWNSKFSNRSNWCTISDALLLSLYKFLNETLYNVHIYIYIASTTLIWSTCVWHVDIYRIKKPKIKWQVIGSHDSHMKQKLFIIIIIILWLLWKQNLQKFNKIIKLLVFKASYLSTLVPFHIMWYLTFKYYKFKSYWKQ